MNSNIRESEEVYYCALELNADNKKLLKDVLQLYESEESNRLRQKFRLRYHTIDAESVCWWGDDIAGFIRPEDRRYLSTLFEGSIPALVCIPGQQPAQVIESYFSTLFLDVRTDRIMIEKITDSDQLVGFDISIETLRDLVNENLNEIGQLRTP